LANLSPGLGAQATTMGYDQANNWLTLKGFLPPSIPRGF
jgi:hypothetical protein